MRKIIITETNIDTIRLIVAHELKQATPVTEIEFTGLVEVPTLNAYIDFLAELNTKGITVTDRNVTWLTDEVLEGMLESKEAFEHNPTVHHSKYTTPLKDLPHLKKAIDMYKTGNYIMDEVLTEAKKGERSGSMSKNTFYRHLEGRGIPKKYNVNNRKK